MNSLQWAHAAPTVTAAFLASLVEFVEALTIVLAVGVTRGWRAALAGSGAAIAVLLVLVVSLRSALTEIPLDAIQFWVGSLLLLFGMRWLRKAILRAGGMLPMHDELLAYERQTAALARSGPTVHRLDREAFFTSFKITMLEGIEVVFIVVALGAGGTDLLWSASIGALAAFLVVLALGAALHRPLARVPENTLKFAVGVLLSAFGTYWVGEGLGIHWPGDDSAILGLIVGYLIVALLSVRIQRVRAGKLSRSIG